jgi:hypothetical protein
MMEKCDSEILRELAERADQGAILFRQRVARQVTTRRLRLKIAPGFTRFLRRNIEVLPRTHHNPCERPQIVQQFRLPSSGMIAGFAGWTPENCNKTPDKTCPAGRFCDFLAVQHLDLQACGCARFSETEGY